MTYGDRSIDFRPDDTGKRVEIGLFEGEDCLDTINLRNDDAIGLLVSLLQAMAEVGITHAQIRAAVNDADLSGREGEAPLQLANETARLWR